VILLRWNGPEHPGPDISGRWYFPNKPVIYRANLLTLENSWRMIARELDVSVGTVFADAHRDHEPESVLTTVTLRD
jgi:hypothetical protein